MNEPKSKTAAVISYLTWVVWIIGISRAARGIWKPIPILGEIDLIQ